MLKSALKTRGIIALLFIALVMGSAYLYQNTAHEFTPYEDRGAFFVVVNGPEGSSFNYIEEYMTEIEQRLMKYVDNGEFKRLLVRAPRGFGNIANFNNGFVIVLLEDWSKRRPASVIMKEVRELLGELPGVRAFPIMRQGLGGRASKPVKFVLGGANYQELAAWRNVILEKIEENNPGFAGIDSDYKETRPQIDFKVIILALPT